MTRNRGKGKKDDSIHIRAKVTERFVFYFSTR